MPPVTYKHYDSDSEDLDGYSSGDSIIPPLWEFFEPKFVVIIRVRMTDTNFFWDIKIFRRSSQYDLVRNVAAKLELESNEFEITSAYSMEELQRPGRSRREINVRILGRWEGTNGPRREAVLKYLHQSPESKEYKEIILSMDKETNNTIGWLLGQLKYMYDWDPDYTEIWFRDQKLAPSVNILDAGIFSEQKKAGGGVVVRIVTRTPPPKSPFVPFYDRKRPRSISMAPKVSLPVLNPIQPSPDPIRIYIASSLGINDFDQWITAYSDWSVEHLKIGLGQLLGLNPGDFVMDCEDDTVEYLRDLRLRPYRNSNDKIILTQPEENRCTIMVTVIGEYEFTNGPYTTCLLYFQDAKSNVLRSCRVNPRTTVSRFKSFVSPLNEYPADQVRVLLNGRMLSDNATLFEAIVLQNSTESTVLMVDY
jgi:hypothetical protein